MFCSVCGAPVQPENRFCASCGTPLAAPATTQLSPPPADSGQWQVVEQSPMAPPTWQQPSEYAAPSAGAPPQYPAQPDYGQGGYPAQQAYYAQQPYDQHWSAQNAPTTAQSPVVYDPYAYAYPHQYVVDEGRRVTPLAVATVLLGAGAVAATTVKVFAGKADGVGPAVKLNEISRNNLTVAVVIAVLAVVAAALGAGYKRFGTGLAGGLGLAAAGWSVLNISFILATLDFQERTAIAQQAQRFTKTYDVGFFLLAGVGALGLLLFVLALPGSGQDGLARVNPITTLLGVVGTLGMALGPLIPQHGQKFADNFSTDFSPVASVVCKLAMLALLAFAGLSGFLNARRWGLGAALGGVSVGAVLWLTALMDDKNRSMGIGLANPGGEPHRPHLATTLGVVAVLAAAVVAAVIAQQRRARAVAAAAEPAALA